MFRISFFQPLFGGTTMVRLGLLELGFFFLSLYLSLVPFLYKGEDPAVELIELARCIGLMAMILGFMVIRNNGEFMSHIAFPKDQKDQKENDRLAQEGASSES